MNPVCVVYLARAKSGWAPFQSFLASYRSRPAGVEHDLLIVLKGFDGGEQVQPFLKEARALRASTLPMSDGGFDLGAYRLAMRQFDYPYFCFFNSFSEILADAWLAKLYSATQCKGVGLVGATGSWESMYTNVLVQRANEPESSLLRRIATIIRSNYCRVCFDPFPNYHIRTNAFLIPRRLMLEIWPLWVPTKRAAYLFETGKNSLTKRIYRSGLKAVVVGKGGRVYEREEWAASGTFRQQAQENLLIADNQTRDYENAAPEARRRLSLLAWGNEARTGEIGTTARQ